MITSLRMVGGELDGYRAAVSGDPPRIYTWARMKRDRPPLSSCNPGATDLLNAMYSPYYQVEYRLVGTFEDERKDELTCIYVPFEPDMEYKYLHNHPEIVEAMPYRFKPR